MKPFARRKRRVFLLSQNIYFISPSVLRLRVFFFLPSGRLVRRLFSFHFPVAGWLREFNKNPKKGATYGQRKYESRHRRKRRFGRLWIYCASRLADSEVGRVRRMRRVGRWFLEISFESFAQDLATPSARSFAQESESQNAMQPARSCRARFSLTGGATSSLPVRRRIGQRGRCPSRCEGESWAAGTLPLPNLQGFASVSLVCLFRFHPVRRVSAGFPSKKPRRNP